MDWITGIQRAVDYIEAHITGDVDLEVYPSDKTDDPNYAGEIWIAVTEKHETAHKNDRQRESVGRHYLRGALTSKSVDSRR